MHASDIINKMQKYFLYGNYTYLSVAVKKEYI